MDKRFGYFAFGGTVIGALLGFAWSGSEYSLSGLAIGALAGAFLGGFVASAVLEMEKQRK